jgi:hypothetical protein
MLTRFIVFAAGILSEEPISNTVGLLARDADSDVSFYFMRDSERAFPQV